MAIPDGTLDTRVREQAKALGATYVGVADLAPARSVVTAQGGDFLGELRFGISAGVVLADAVVDQLSQHASRDITRTYYHHIYGVVNPMLDRIAATLAFEIERVGYRAFPVPASSPYDGERLRGLVSHKLVAHLSGQGWIGKNALLVTREHGPRVRWVSVLTDAPLTATAPARDGGDECKECRLCVELCPAHAFTGVAFNPAEDVEARFHRSKCRSYLSARDKAYGASACGICVHVCPHGWSAKRKPDAPRTTAAELRRRLGTARADFEASLPS